MLGEENIPKHFISGRAYTELHNLIAECGNGVEVLHDSEALKRYFNNPIVLTALEKTYSQPCIQLFQYLKTAKRVVSKTEVKGLKLVADALFSNWIETIMPKLKRFALVNGYHLEANQSKYGHRLTLRVLKNTGETT